MAEALEAVYPRTTLQTCIVHLLRNSLNYAGYKERKGLAEALKPIYQAVSAEAAEAALEAFAEGEWGQRFPTVAAAWRRAAPRWWVGRWVMSFTFEYLRARRATGVRPRGREPERGRSSARPPAAPQI